MKSLIDRFKSSQSCKNQERNGERRGAEEREDDEADYATTVELGRVVEVD